MLPGVRGGAVEPLQRVCVPAEVRLALQVCGGHQDHHQQHFHGVLLNTYLKSILYLHITFMLNSSLSQTGSFKITLKRRK